MRGGGGGGGCDSARMNGENKPAAQAAPVGLINIVVPDTAAVKVTAGVKGGHNERQEREKESDFSARYTTLFIVVMRFVSYALFILMRPREEVCPPGDFFFF